MRPGVRVLALLAAALLAGCTTAGRPVSTRVPEACHGASTPFSTFALEIVEAPGFKEPIMRGALLGALERLGLEQAPAPEADLRVVLRVTRIERRPFAETPEPDPVSPNVPSSAVSRFTAHADIEVRDRRDGRLVYEAGMDRDHAISGDARLHDARAKALIATALDRALAGLTTPCD